MKPKERPLTIVMDKDMNHCLMVGPYVVKDVVNVKDEEVWERLDLDRPTGLAYSIAIRPPRVRQRHCHVDTRDCQLAFYEELSDAYLPRWMLKLKYAWKKFTKSLQST